MLFRSAGKYLISTGHFNYIPSPFISAHHFKRVSPHISSISYLGTKNINMASSHIYIAVYLGSAYQKQIIRYLTLSAMQRHQTSKYHGISSHRVLYVESVSIHPRGIEPGSCELPTPPVFFSANDRRRRECSSPIPTTPAPTTPPASCPVPPPPIPLLAAVSRPP